MSVESKRISIRASDGHVLAAYQARPDSAPRGGIVLLHEIFGVNSHIREVCNGYAGRGYLTIAPALFDRAERDIELGDDRAGIDKGRDLRGSIDWDATLLDVQAAIHAAGTAGSVGVIGYCWGGTLAFLAATRLEGASCAIGYYGGQTMPFAHEKPRVPVLLHFGAFDPRVPEADIALIRAHNP